MDFLIKNTKGLTLKTKGKYCTEDLVIEIDPSLVEGYMEVDELPEVGLPRVLYKLMLEEPEYYIWENEEWVQLNTKGGGGLIEVTELPEVGEEDVVYKLVKQGGTAVPNSGYVENVYFNTSKDYESYYNLFEKLDYIDYLGSLVYPVLFNPDVYMLYIKKTIIDGVVSYGIYYQNLSDGSHHPSAPIIVHDGNLEIWSPDFIERGSYVEVNNNVIDNLQGINIGLQNDLLTDFISIGQSFGSNTEEYYLYENGAWKQISGGFKNVDVLPSVGNENYTYILKKDNYEIYVKLDGLGYVVNFIEYIKGNGASSELVGVFDSKDQLPTENIKVSNGEKELYFYYVKNDDIYMYGPFNEDGNSWAGLSDVLFPFGGEITDTSEITAINTLYVLNSGGIEGYYIYDNTAKPVPNKGTISEIYFNTDLSVEEVVAELSKLTFDIGLYFLLVTQEPRKVIWVTYDATEDFYTITDVNADEDVRIFVSNEKANTGFVGWNTTVLDNGKYAFENPIELVAEYSGVILGSENWKITNVVRVFENKWTKISGINIVKQVLTQVPNSGYVDTVYFNTEISENDIHNLIDTLTLYQTPFFDFPVYPLLFSSDFNFGIILSVVDDDFYGKIYIIAYANAITNETTNLYYKITNSETEYTPLTTKELVINKEVITEYGGLPIGAENDKLINLISTTPFGLTL